MPERSRKRVWIVRGVIGLFLFFIWCAATIEIIPYYPMESSDRGFATGECPAKGSSLNRVEREFEKYKKWKGNESLSLCRTGVIPWWSPWEWYEIVTHRRWRLPYMAPSPKPNHQQDYLYPERMKNKPVDTEVIE